MHLPSTDCASRNSLHRPFRRNFQRRRTVVSSVDDQLPSLHCTVIVFALDWESHKSLKHDRECLTELLERALFQPHAIQRIQLAELGWESHKGFERKRGWVVLSLVQPFLYLFDA